jgi:hypothetical protein
MNTYSRNTLISSIFAGVVVAASVFGFSNALFNTVDDVAEITQQSSNLTVKQVTQTVNAQNNCPGYSQELDGDGDCERSESSTITVVLASAPSINPSCTTNPQVADTDDDITFDASGSTASSSITITGYEWTFGDGTTRTTSNPTATHSYSDDGEYAVDVNVIGNGGSYSESVSCPSPDIQNRPPTATPDWSPDDPVPGSTLTYSVDTLNTSDPDGDIESWNWTITKPDGTTDSDTGISGGSYNPELQIGEYVVNLTVVDDDGALGSGTDTVEVSDYDPSFNWNPQQETVWVVADEPATSTEATFSLNPTGNPPIPPEDITLNITSNSSEIDTTPPANELNNISPQDVNDGGGGGGGLQPIIEDPSQPSPQQPVDDDIDVYVDRSGGNVSLTVNKSPDGLETGTYEIYLEATASTTVGTVTKTATTTVRSQTTAEF